MALAHISHELGDWWDDVLKEHPKWKELEELCSNYEYDKITTLIKDTKMTRDAIGRVMDHYVSYSDDPKNLKMLDTLLSAGGDIGWLVDDSLFLEYVVEHRCYELFKKTIIACIDDDEPFTKGHIHWCITCHDLNDEEQNKFWDTYYECVSPGDKTKAAKK